VNLVDGAVIILAGLSAYRGWRLGFLRQLFELGGGFIGLVAGIVLGPKIAGMFTDKPDIEAALVSLVVVFVFLSIGQTLGFMLGHRAGSIAKSARLGKIDSGAGSAFGITVTLISFWLIGSLLVRGPSLGLAKQLRNSTILQAVNDVLPPPPDVLALLGTYLDDSGFPQVFTGLPPQIRPPVDLPSSKVARKAIAAADQSTVRVVVPACGGTQLGSGWVAGESTIVTNAHVVAGGDSVTIQDGAGDHSGVVVLFDPDTDVAVIHSEGLDGPPLNLITEILDRGTQGATLGYPGNADGRLVPQPAAIQADYEAKGKDIYGQRDVNRKIYELRAKVRQGDSGGPFVLPDGDVAGVVFAASTTDGDTGYALTGAEVEDEVQKGLSRTSAVSTGGCTR
jgi:S1-C subfamily serine protease